MAITMPKDRGALLASSWWRKAQHRLDGASPIAVLSPASGRSMLNGRAANDNALVSRQGGIKYVVGADGVLSAIPTNTLAYDWSSGVRELLLEGQATNLFLNSFAPATQSITTAAQTYTLSFWGTGTVVLSGSASATLAGTGANSRAFLTFTAGAGTLTCTVTGSVSRAQVETGSVATSYIPTAGATVTRLADIAPLWSGAGAATAWAWRGNVLVAVASSILLGAGASSYLRCGTGNPSQVLMNGRSDGAAVEVAPPGTIPGTVGACIGWGSSGRSACTALGTTNSNPLLCDLLRTSMAVGATGGVVIGQVLRLRELVAWQLPDRPSATGCQSQARLWSA